MSSNRILLILILFFLTFLNICFSQEDSSKIKIGAEELLNMKPGYRNFSDKNKVNIEVTVLGVGAGKYLIPQGTTLFDFILLSGATNSKILDDVKIVRFKSDTPKLQGSEVFQFNYVDLYGDKNDILKPIQNPILKPGDMVIFPEAAKEGPGIFFYIQQTIYFIGTLISFYYLIDNTYNRFR